MKKRIPNDKYLLNLPIKANIGDLVLYSSYNDKGDSVQKEAKIINETDFMYITSINIHKIPIGFHKSRLIKILESQSQLQIFNIHETNT
jgi:hypothetical protein